ARFTQNPKIEKLDDLDLLLSSTDDLAAAFVDNYFLIGPPDAVRRCLRSRTQGQSGVLPEAIRQSTQLVDVSRPISAMTVTNDELAAIAFVEALAHEDRSPFASNGDAIRVATRTLPYAVSVSLLKGSAIEWTSRSSFGVGGSLMVQLLPESTR